MWQRRKFGKNQYLHVLPKKITPTEQFGFSGEAFVCEGGVTVEAADATSVPWSFQDIEEEFVQDRLVAAGTGYQHPRRWFATT